MTELAEGFSQVQQHEASPPHGITVSGVTKRFGPVAAVDHVTLAIGEGEFFSLLGPSGCGKTTTLRMIAGFEILDDGRILLRGADVTAAPANKRNVNMVFQQYALFPHMNVAANVAFGLKMKRVARDERRRRVSEILRVVGLEGLEFRRPQQLSGGQQQRVALARALVNEPAALLLDEPLGALDVKLRRQMQLELKRIQRELRTTFVYVTHDQEEALAMSDRIAVMHEGRVQQIGSPQEMYEQPATAFVADFIGSLNALTLRADDADGSNAVVRLGEGERVVVPLRGCNVVPGEVIRVAVRPERVQILVGGAHAAQPSLVTGRVAELIYLGSLTQFHVDTTAGRIVAHRVNNGSAPALAVGDRVTLSWLTEDAYLLR